MKGSASAVRRLRFAQRGRDLREAVGGVCLGALEGDLVGEHGPVVLPCFGLEAVAGDHVHRPV